MEAELIESISAKRRKRRSEFTRSHPALSALSPSYSSFPRSVFVSPSPPSLPLSSHLGGFWFPINHHSTYCSNQGHVSMCCNLTPLWLKIGCFCRKCGEIHTHYGFPYVCPLVLFIGDVLFIGTEPTDWGLTINWDKTLSPAPTRFSLSLQAQHE